MGGVQRTLGLKLELLDDLEDQLNNVQLAHWCRAHSAIELPPLPSEFQRSPTRSNAASTEQLPAEEEIAIKRESIKQMLCFLISIDPVLVPACKKACLGSKLWSEFEEQFGSTRN